MWTWNNYLSRTGGEKVKAIHGGNKLNMLLPMYKTWSDKRRRRAEFIESILNLIPYQLDDDSLVGVIFKDDTIWISQKEMGNLFEVKTPAISKHLKNIFDEGELGQNSVVSKMEITASDGKSYDIQHYNLDAIISVGYRVNSQKATQFRIWANNVLKQYIRDGYVINESAFLVGSIIAAYRPVRSRYLKINQNYAA